MRIVLSHVTNSSSSSFVVATRSIPDFDAETIAKYPSVKFLKKLISGLFGDDKPISTLQELEERLIDGYLSDDDKEYFNKLDSGEEFTEEEKKERDVWLDNQYLDSKKYIEQGFTIYNFSIDYNNETGYDLIKSLEDKENFFILRSE